MDFETRLNNLRANSEYSELLDIDIAMWPEDAVFHDDLSNNKKYNDIFIEVSDDESVRGDYILYIVFFFHNFGLILFFYHLIANGNFSWGFLFLPAMAWGFFFIFFFGIGQGGVRFNRRAQLLHIGRGKNKAATVAWRDVKPFLSSSIAGHNLELFFPIPEVEREEFNDDQLKKIHRGKPYLVQGHMDWRDPGMYGSLGRLEFYRRYMEQGLDAVQPDPDKVPQDAIRPPSPAAQRHRDQGFFLYWILDPISNVGKWLAGGPLLDRALRKQAKKFKWPEEVEHLCSPDADLSDLDTRPVKPRKDIFYRPGGINGIHLVNAKGQQLV
ncbi:hypothetical protein KN811_05495 [Sinomicrobium sp. 2019215]|uniref:hypothetical protein n=1 Tax=Sinomicrobium weinanense TaxID=2842200 RepID=UPI001C0AB09C|nr:hypothetical protein [Sinomicrobium weinanense]MBU3122856.1 hypothetical protein [Sinomicrobium weinanense]